MRRTTTLLAAMACAISAWMVLAIPASAQIRSGGRHGADTAQAAPASPHSGFAEGLRDHFGFSSANGAAPPSDGQPAAPPVARYLVESTVSFTLDMSGPLPLLRYSNSSEVWALKPQAAPRGDVLYTNDAGETMLRATRLGGLTAFTPDQPQGVAAALMGSAQPIIALPDIRSGGQLLLRMNQQSGHLSHMAGHEIEFDASNQDVGPESLPLLADAFNVTVDAFTRALSPQNAKKKTFIPDLSAVRIKEGVPPDAYIQNDALVLVITPARGIAGRPSSHRIFKVLLR
jgi:hypothetical protein